MKAQNEYANHNPDKDGRSRRSVGGYSEEAGIKLLHSILTRAAPELSQIARKKETPIDEIGV